jgi:ubiquinone/menaquinone biosynthesis C-methylase UbiE
MDNSKVAVKIYEKIASAYAKKFNQPSEHIDDFMASLSGGKKVLDVGCGPGVDAKYLHDKGCNVTGVDLSKNMIDIAKKTIREVDFKVKDMRKMNFPNSSFDGIFIAYSLIHIPKEDVKAVIEKAYNLLKEDGILYVAVQTGESKELFVTEPLDPKEQIFLNIFSKDEIEKNIQRAGFSIIKEFERDVQKPGEFNFTKLFILAHK